MYGTGCVPLLLILRVGRDQSTRPLCAVFCADSPETFNRRKENKRGTPRKKACITYNATVSIRSEYSVSLKSVLRTACLVDLMIIPARHTYSETLEDSFPEEATVWRYESL